MSHTVTLGDIRMNMGIVVYLIPTYTILLW